MCSSHPEELAKKKPPLDHNSVKGVDQDFSQFLVHRMDLDFTVLALALKWWVRDELFKAPSPHSPGKTREVSVFWPCQLLKLPNTGGAVLCLARLSLEQDCGRVQYSPAKH